jgi:hypothetical protein
VGSSGAVNEMNVRAKCCCWCSADESEVGYWYNQPRRDLTLINPAKRRISSAVLSPPTPPSASSAPSFLLSFPFSPAACFPPQLLLFPVLCGTPDGPSWCAHEAPTHVIVVQGHLSLAHAHVFVLSTCSGAQLDVWHGV